MKKTKKALASLAIAGMALTMTPFNTFAASTVPTRLAGGTAAQTAAIIADQTGWTDTAILASSASYCMVDALTAGPLAMFLKAPILLTEPGNVLNADTKAELTKLNVKTVYVTSGTAVISQAVLNELKGMGISVESLGGVDRFATSANIAQKMVTLGATVNKVAVAYGWLNQDALSIASIAAAQTQPILLTERDTIPTSVKAFLTANPSVKTTDVIGGTGVISDAVSAQFPSAARQYGNTAYDTNKAVLKAFDGVLKYDNVFLANGETAIDALTGAPLAALYNAGIVLVNGAANEGTIYVSSKLSATSIVTALGGTAVVTDSVLKGVSNSGTVIPPSSGGTTTDPAEITATDLVVKAEESRTQVDKDAALTAVNALPASVNKTALLTRANAIVVAVVDLPTYTITAQESELLGVKIITVTLNTANDTQYTVSVDGTKLEYSTLKDSFVGLLETTNNKFTTVVTKK